MEDKKKKQSGFTLVEVLLSMAMLMVVVVPLLSYFSNNARYNHRAKVQQRTLTVAEKVMEEAKSFPTIKAMYEAYDTSGGAFTEKSSGTYEFWKNGVESENGIKYNVKITVDPFNNLNYDAINKNGTVAITSLTQSNTAVAKDKEETRQNAIAYFVNKSKYTKSEEEVGQALNKTYFVDVVATKKIDSSDPEKKKQYIVVKISVKYGCSIVEGEYSELMHNGLEIDEQILSGIYLFYNYYDNTEIKVNLSPGLKIENAKLYAICQNVDTNKTQEIEISGLGKKEQIFSNVRYNGNTTADTTDKMLKTMPVQRISDIKVEVFEPVSQQLTIQFKR